MPGTITPEPEPVDDESDAALPSASTAETCVVPPAGAGSGRPAVVGDGGRLGERSSERSRCASPPRWSASRERVVADARLFAHHLREGRDRRGGSRRPRADASSSASP